MGAGAPEYVKRDLRRLARLCQKRRAGVQLIWRHPIEEEIERVREFIRYASKKALIERAQARGNPLTDLRLKWRDSVLAHRRVIDANAGTMREADREITSVMAAIKRYRRRRRQHAGTIKGFWTRIRHALKRHHQSNERLAELFAAAPPPYREWRRTEAGQPTPRVRAPRRAANVIPFDQARRRLEAVR